jgi:hypothetical protein
MGSHAIARACFERQVGGARVKTVGPQPVGRDCRALAAASRPGDVALAVDAGRYADSLTAWIIGHDGWPMELGRDGQSGGHASGSQRFARGAS